MAEYIKNDKAKREVKISYSKLSTLDSCGWKYHLTYDEGLYFGDASLSNEFGTLVHYIEQQIGIAICNGEKIDYEKLKQDFQTINLPKTSKYDHNGDVFGINILKEKYGEEFYKTDDRGRSFYTKANDYMDYGMYRLEKYLKENPNLELRAMEKYFSITIDGYVFSGYIDRLLYDNATDTYVIEDIKTRDKLFSDEDLVTPLQFVIYVLGLRSVFGDENEEINFICKYDLPLCGQRQSAGTKGYMKRGEEKIKKLLNKIKEKDYAPHPSPLCYWCTFGAQNPHIKEAALGYCPYYSLWTPENRSHSVANKWLGLDHHDIIIQKEKDKIELRKKFDVDFDF